MIIGTKRTLTGTKAAASTLTKGAKTGGRVIASAARTGRRVVQVVSGMVKTASVAAKAGIGAIAAISYVCLVRLCPYAHRHVCIFSIFLLLKATIGNSHKHTCISQSSTPPWSMTSSKILAERRGFLCLLSQRGSIFRANGGVHRCRLAACISGLQI